MKRQLFFTRAVVVIILLTESYRHSEIWSVTEVHLQ